MLPEDDKALSALLAHIRALRAELAERHAGVCVLHMEAAEAALESQLRRASGAPRAAVAASALEVAP